MHPLFLLSPLVTREMESGSERQSSINRHQCSRENFFVPLFPVTEAPAADEADASAACQEKNKIVIKCFTQDWMLESIQADVVPSSIDSGSSDGSQWHLAASQQRQQPHRPDVLHADVAQHLQQSQL